MRTLLIESTPGVGARAAEQLRAAGGDVLSCWTAEHPTFPCTEVTDRGSCPLRGERGADVALVVRGSDDARATGAEGAVTCALQEQVPVAVLGAGPSHPFAGWVEPTHSHDPVEACEQAMASFADRQAAPLRHEVERLLAGAGEPTDGVEVEIRRHGDRGAIEVRLPRRSAVAAEAIATAVHAKHRALGGHHRTLDVAVLNP